MSRDVTIRRAEPADAPRLRELNEVALRQVDAYAEDAVGLEPDEPSVADERSSSSPGSQARQDADAPEDAVEEGMDEDLEDVEANYVDVGGDFFVAETVGRGDAAAGGAPGGDSDGDSVTGDERRIVGMGALEPVGEGTFQADRIVRAEDGPAAEITRMRVDPAFQRRGIGTRLVERIEERARELGYEVLVLDTTARQTGAQRLYESFGYECETTVEWREYEVVLYRKALDGDRAE